MWTSLYQQLHEHAHAHAHTGMQACQSRWKLCMHASINTWLSHTCRHTRARTTTCQPSGGNNGRRRLGGAGKQFILNTVLFSLSHASCISVFRHYHSHLFLIFLSHEGFLPPSHSLPPSLLNLISFSVSLSPFFFSSSVFSPPQGV